MKNKNHTKLHQTLLQIASLVLIVVSLLFLAGVKILSFLSK